MVQATPKTILRPQAGNQEEFLACPYTEVFYGGEAGGGKSWALTLDALRYYRERNYSAVIFRRHYPDLEDLIHKTMEIYKPLGFEFKEQKHQFVHPQYGSRIKFNHLQHSKDIYNHQGQEYDFIGFDELPQFPELAYVYLFSRLRGTNPNIERYIRSTGNPDGEGVLWVKARFIDKLAPMQPKWFLTVGGRDIEVSEGTPESISRCFIPSIRSQNLVLTQADPNYEARLNQLPEAQKNALKYGSWNIQDKANQVIKSEWWARAISGEVKYNGGQSKDFGADFAHEGADKSVCYYGMGNQPRWRKAWPQTKATEYGRMLAGFMRDEGYHNCWVAVDCNGPGAGTGDTLSEIPEVSSRFERCIEKDFAFDVWAKQKYAGRIQFNNWRSQAWWKLREDMENGEIDLSVLAKGDGYFDDWNRLQQEILIHTFVVESGKVVVISKKELRKADSLGRSPDDADALVLWNWGRGKGLLGSTKAVDMNADYGLARLREAEDTTDEAEAWA